MMLPVTFTNADIAITHNVLTDTDIIGIVLFFIGFLVEVVSDFQKDKFRKNPANNNSVCNVGLWKWSRHPNFFGGLFLCSYRSPRHPIAVSKNIFIYINVYICMCIYCLFVQVVY